MSESTQPAPEKPYTVVVAGGGTAGHIEPALAVAEALRDHHGIEVHALGTPRGLEGDLIPARGFQLHLIDPVPVPRKPSGELFRLPAKVRRAVKQTKAVLKEVGADAVIGFGGYVCAPAYLAARSLKLPIYIHEANARAGMANKLGVYLGGHAFTAVSGSGLEGEVVGIPVRGDINDDPTGEHAARGRELWQLDQGLPTVLVTGGSQGALSINNALAGALDEITNAGIQVLHAHGKKHASIATDNELYHGVDYITDMAAAYAAADLIVARSGAMTVAEVSAAGLPAVYIPLPHGNGEQGLNASEAIASGAARLIDDGELDGAALSQAVIGILGEPATLDDMRHKARADQAGHAAETIAARIVGDIAAGHGKDEHK